MKFSVIIPSYLGNYANAASNRELKIIRAIESVYNQTFQDFEIIVVADGCDKTYEIVEKYFRKRGKLSCYLIPKQKTWSGKVRSIGIEKASGEFITYLDIDDYWKPEFLESINKQIKSLDWAYFNDNHINKENLLPLEIHIEVDKHTGTNWRAGTSNIVHKRSLGVIWDNNSYQHDQIFIQDLKKTSRNYDRISNPGYVVCHVPGKLDV